MIITIRTRIPVSNTVTALEVWLLACMLLVFLSLVEYAVILRQIVIYKRWVRDTDQMRRRRCESWIYFDPDGFIKHIEGSSLTWNVLLFQNRKQDSFLSMILLYSSETFKNAKFSLKPSWNCWKFKLYIIVLMSIQRVHWNVYVWLLIVFRKKDVSLGSHNPLCDYHHDSNNSSSGQHHSANSNNYTTINYNHPNTQVNTY